MGRTYKDNRGKWRKELNKRKPIKPKPRERKENGSNNGGGYSSFDDSIEEHESFS